MHALTCSLNSVLSLNCWKEVFLGKEHICLLISPHYFSVAGGIRTHVSAHAHTRATFFYKNRFLRHMLFCILPLKNDHFMIFFTAIMGMVC